jgi:hypothetical protein
MNKQRVRKKNATPKHSSSQSKSKPCNGAATSPQNTSQIEIAAEIAARLGGQECPVHLDRVKIDPDHLEVSVCLPGIGQEVPWYPPAIFDQIMRGIAEFREEIEEHVIPNIQDAQSRVQLAECCAWAIHYLAGREIGKVESGLKIGKLELDNTVSIAATRTYSLNDLFFPVVEAVYNNRRILVAALYDGRPYLPHQRYCSRRGQLLLCEMLVLAEAVVAWAGFHTHDGQWLSPLQELAWKARAREAARPGPGIEDPPASDGMPLLRVETEGNPLPTDERHKIVRNVPLPTNCASSASKRQMPGAKP